MTRTPGSSKPRYPIPWIATYFITGLVLIIGSFVVAWYLDQLSTDYDYSDPDMVFLERIVLSGEPQRGDFTGLNGGNWQALCLAGWQGDLREAVKRAKLTRARAKAILAAHHRRSDDVIESAFTLVYADKSDRVKALIHPHGFAFARAGQAVCTDPSNPVLHLPVASAR